MPDNNKGESQAEKFKKAARELGTDEDEARFDAVLKKVAKPSPQVASPPRPKRTVK